jgi:hypothetical protein
MDLNTIEIPDLLITELYRDHLLATEGYTATATKRSSLPPAGPAPKDISVTAAGSTLPKAPTHPIGAVPRTTPTPAPEAAAEPAMALAATPTSTPASTTSSTPAPPAYKYLGRNQKRITIIVQSPGIAFLPDDQLNVLTKMLEACRMNIGDVAIVNHINTPIVITTLKEQLNPSIVLLFGIQPVEIRLPINFPTFKIQAYDECTYLYAPPLSELVPPTAESKLLKSKLWICLKDLFGV